MERQQPKNRYRPFGIELDPENELREKISPDGEPLAFYHNSEIPFMDMIDLLEERTTRISRGKKPAEKRFFMRSRKDGS